MRNLILVFLLGSVLVADEKGYEYSSISSMDIKNSRYTKLYKSECGACHMAFQPEFLPKRSWRKMMGSLKEHFGVDATVDKKDFAKLNTYLMTNASDTKKLKGEIAEIAYSIKRNSTPLYITRVPYFKKEHREIPKRLITQKEVKTLSNCMACHKKADKGLFEDRTLNIPNHGKWYD